MTFLNFGIIDFIDIMVVAYLMYKVYSLIRGSVAINIFTVIVLIYFLWMVTKALSMELLSSILGQFIGVGVLALVIVFQPEIRRFFLLIYSEYLSKFNFSLEKLFTSFVRKSPGVKIYTITKACINMSKSNTGALMVISNISSLETYASTGIILNAITTDELLESIFFKNSPLHDGAVIIVKDKIVAARCILPLSENVNLPSNFGLRHRSAMGISEATNSLTIVVSEETGEISWFKNAKYKKDVSGIELRKILEKEFYQKDTEDDKDASSILSQIDLNPFKN